MEHWNNTLLWLIGIPLPIIFLIFLIAVLVHPS
jgi:hypothetical protein